MAGLSLCLLVVAVLAWLALADGRHEVDLPSADRSGPSAAGAAETLHDLVRAWEAGDADAARSLAPGDDAAAGRTLAAVAENVREMGITDLSLRYVDEAGAAAPDGSWPAAVDLTWRVGSFDRTPAQTEVAVTFVRDGDRVAVVGLATAGPGDADRLRAPVWFTGAARVRRTDELVVVVDADLPGAAVERYVGLAARAVPAVRDVLAGWRPRVVVEVPEDASGVDRVLGSRSGTYARVAAVTASADGSRTPRSAVRVVVNPDELDRLGPVAAQVVMTHEVVHVALGAATSSGAVPLWLVEGTADVVALRDVHLPLTRTAGQLAEQVRREGVPDHLPGPDEFDTVTGGHLGAAYESAWLACEVLVDRVGVDGLIEVYRATERGVPLDRALRRYAGLRERQLLRRWQERLSDLVA